MTPKPIIDQVLDWLRSHDGATFFMLTYLFVFVVATASPGKPWTGFATRGQYRNVKAFHSLL